MTTINISNKKIKKVGGVVILPIEEYQRLQESAAPVYYLSGKAAKDLDSLVGKGQREYRSGKTIKANSLKEAFTRYGKKKGN